MLEQRLLNDHPTPPPSQRPLSIVHPPTSTIYRPPPTFLPTSLPASPQDPPMSLLMSLHTSLPTFTQRSPNVPSASPPNVTTSYHYFFNSHPVYSIIYFPASTPPPLSCSYFSFIHSLLEGVDLHYIVRQMGQV